MGTVAVVRSDHSETQLRNHMLDPGDLTADSALRTIRHDYDGVLARQRAAKQ